MIHKVHLTKPDSFRLGSRHLQLSELSKLLKSVSKKATATDQLWLTIDDQWLDLSLLSYLGQLLRNAQDSFVRIRVRMPEFTDSKIRFLHKLGFWELIGVGRGNASLRCEPDPIVSLPANIRERLNYSSFVTCSCAKANSDNLVGVTAADTTEASTTSTLPDQNQVKEAVRRFDRQLQEASVYPLVAQTDAMWSKEYLYLLVWELLNNACQHSESDQAIVAAQIFLSCSEISESGASTDADFGLRRTVLESLARQHDAEISNNTLENRGKWLSRHRETSFLLISCTDCGIGIADSLRRREIPEVTSDVEAIEAAFDPDNSLGMTNPELYDVHGLSQILRLVRQYSGYLYVQSGLGRLDADCERNSLSYEPVPAGERLDGVTFQILLPLMEPRHLRTLYDLPSRQTISLESPKPALQGETLHVIKEMGQKGKALLRNPELWHDFVHSIVTRTSIKDAPVLYVDLLGVPRQRQFISYFLRCLRKVRLLKSTLVVNAFPEILTVARSLVRLDKEMSVTSANDAAINLLEENIATVLTRGEIGSLPLLLPFVSLGDKPGSLGIIWLGLSALPQRWRSTVAAALEHLFEQEQLVEWEALIYILGKRGLQIATQEERDFLRLMYCISRCNPSILGADKQGIWLEHTPTDLYRLSYGFMLSLFERDILPSTRHKKSRNQEHYLYSRAWHITEKRFSKYYYFTWAELVDRSKRLLCAKLLITKAYQEIGESFLNTEAVVSVTPSAGLLGRCVADLMGADFCEAPSIYDIADDEWLLTLKAKEAVIVDDMIDTGTTTKRLISRIEDAGSTCTAVLSLLASEEGVKERDGIACPLVCLSKVTVGTPSPEEISQAMRTGQYFETEPHTLEPIPPRAGGPFINQEHEQLLEVLVSAGAITSGHIAYSGHHYEVYFSLPDALAHESVRARMLDWVISNIVRFSETNKVKGRYRPVTIVYPYYSPIDRLIEALETEHSAGKIRDIPVNYVVAQPYQLSGKRRGYRIVQSTEHGARSQTQLAVFLDDGIASGGTMAGIIDQLVRMHVDAIYALVLFDRIGLQPRRHISQIAQYSYEGKTVPFCFEAFVSANLKSFYRDNCPQCQLLASIGRIPESKHILSTTTEKLSTLLGITGVERYPIGPRAHFDEQALFSILRFRNAVLSDKPSPIEIEKSLDDQSKHPEVRLECLRTILMDQKLFRQLIDKKKVNDIIVRCLSDPQVKSELRIRFILFTPLWEDKPYAYTVLTEVLPQAFSQLADKDPLGKPWVGGYFHKNGLEFSSVLAAVYLLFERSPRHFQEQGDNWLENWRQAISRGAPDVTCGSIYLFALRTLFMHKHEYGIEQAKYLVASFRGSYSTHADAFVERLKHFRGALNAGLLDVAFTRYMPKEIWDELLGNIESTQELFDLGEFTTQDITDLRNAYTQCREDEDAEELNRLITKHFLPTNPAVYPARIRVLVDRFSPLAAEVIDEGIKLVARKYQASLKKDRLVFERPVKNQRVAFVLQIDCDETTGSESVLGRKGFLAECVSHLITNAVEAWLAHKDKTEATTSNDAIKLELCARAGTLDTFEFLVIDDCPVEGEDLERVVNSKVLSGIQMHRQMLSRWNADIEVREINGGKKAVVLKAHKLDAYCTK